MTPTLKNTLHQAIPLLSAMYSEPHRHYHSLIHIHELLQNIVTGKYLTYLDRKKISRIAKNEIHPHTLIELEQIDILSAIAWFHDCYYDPYMGSPNNEAISAYIAESFLGHLQEDEYDKFQVVKYGVIATGYHLKDLIEEYTPTYTRLKLEHLIFMDLDLLSFAFPENNARNNQNIRNEYYKTTDSEYTAGRLNFLNSLYSKKRIFYTFNDELETAAKQNIANQLKELQ